MSTIFKPHNYNSLSPYLIVDNAQNFIDFTKKIFNAKQLRRFDRENRKIAHCEIQIDDTVIMVSDSPENFPANKTMLHIYVADVFKTFEKAIENGCEIIERPINKKGDPDIRGSFYDFAGNYWAVSTQIN
ncbi:MAG: VOC family protein [Ginsengibacter sp.]